MKVYKTINNEIIITSNERTDCGDPICERLITPDEILWHSRGCLKVQGNDVVIDTVKKTTWESNKKTDLISEHTKNNGTIDRHTSDILSNGYDYVVNNIIVAKLSCSLAAQHNFHALVTWHKILAVPIPINGIEISQRDGLPPYYCQDLTTLMDIASKYMPYIKSKIESGNAQKLLVNDIARTLIELENYVDNRT